jgi:Trypsin
VQNEDGQLDCMPPPVDYVIEEIIPHPQYDPKNPSKHHDLAILRLNESVKYNDFVRPICLPTKEYNKGLTPNFVHTVTGWGKTDHCE